MHGFSGSLTKTYKRQPHLTFWDLELSEKSWDLKLMDTAKMHSYLNSYKIHGVTDNPPVYLILTTFTMKLHFHHHHHHHHFSETKYFSVWSMEATTDFYVPWKVELFA